MTYTEQLQVILQKAEDEYQKTGIMDGRMIFKNEYKTEMGPFRTFHDYTNLCLVIMDDADHFVKRIIIENHFNELDGALKERALNYILFKKGMLYLRSYGQRETDDKIRTLKRAYEKMVDLEFITPINSIYSEKYALQEIVNVLTADDYPVKEAEVMFLIDYEYFEKNYRFPNQIQHCLKATFICQEGYYELGMDNEFEIFQKVNFIYEALIKKGFNFKVVYAMKEEDENRLKKNWKYEFLKN